jgi:hypothetical protein
MEREADAGMPSLQDRARDVALAKRAERLASLTGAALQSQILKNAREDRKTAKKIADFATFRSIPGNEHATTRQFYAARKAGVLASVPTSPTSPDPPLVAAPPPTPLEAAPPKHPRCWWIESDSDED